MDAAKTFYQLTAHTDQGPLDYYVDVNYPLADIEASVRRLVTTAHPGITIYSVKVKV